MIFLLPGKASQLIDRQFNEILWSKKVAIFCNILVYQLACNKYIKYICALCEHPC